MSSNKHKYKRNNSHRHFHKKFGANLTNNQPKRKYSHQNQLTEPEVGISEFISKLSGFSGIIKARYSDFHVNEIDLDGHIAKLTNTAVPKDFGKESEEELQFEVGADSPMELIPQQTWEAIVEMMKSNGDPVKLDASDFSKEDRAKVHQCLRAVFKQKIVATTINKNNEKFMEFKKYSPADRADHRFKWPENTGEYVHFLVYKESLDTLDASFKISDCLRMQSSHFTYAGVKDKRAKTTQWFSVRKVEPWKLIIKTKPLKSIRIGNITFKDHPVKLGQLLGNKFRIALRNVIASDDLIGEAMEGLSKNGFINYYGMQRFGNDKETPTFAIGVQLLLGNWKEACAIILKSTKSDDPDLDITKAKKIYSETSDASKALKQFRNSKNKCIEYKLLEGLSKNHTNDYVTALETIPRNIRLLYLHSFQSLVWNFVTSKRISKYGLEPVEGDLVLLSEVKVEKDEDDEESTEKLKQEVISLTKDDLAKYTIYDVVLPLPGYDVIYPENMRDSYKEILEKYGLTLEMTKQKVRTYNLSGNYRKILGQIQDLSWKIMYFNNPNDNLIRSDYEELKNWPEPKNVENGKYKALVVEFSLNSSSYATMVLREILKSDTSSSAHASMNNYHVEKPVIDKDPEKKCEEQIDFVRENSLLNDEEKYQKFKSSVFGEITKRKLDDNEEESEAKVFKSS